MTVRDKNGHILDKYSHAQQQQKIRWFKSLSVVEGYRVLWMMLLSSGRFPTNPSELCKECVPDCCPRPDVFYNENRLQEETPQQCRLRCVLLWFMDFFWLIWFILNLVEKTPFPSAVLKLFFHMFCWNIRILPGEDSKMRLLFEICLNGWSKHLKHIET